MKLKGFISTMLLAVYLMAAGGSAVLSLSCSCVAMHTASVHVCCHHCHHETTDVSAMKDALEAPCCGDHHSTEIDLYTGSPSWNSERLIRCVVTDLPPMLVAEAPAAACLSLCGERLCERCTPFVERGHVRCAGLRAPPVLA